jgi:hypothetical protein
MTAPACEICGVRGGLDSSARDRRQGRRNQGAMTPLYAATERSESLDMDVCPRHFSLLFYRLTMAVRAGERRDAALARLVAEVKAAL